MMMTLMLLLMLLLRLVLMMMLMLWKIASHWTKWQVTQETSFIYALTSRHIHHVFLFFVFSCFPCPPCTMSISRSKQFHLFGERFSFSLPCLLKFTVNFDMLNHANHVSPSTSDGGGRNLNLIVFSLLLSRYGARRKRETKKNAKKKRKKCVSHYKTAWMRRPRDRGHIKKLPLMQLICPLN